MTCQKDLLHLSFLASTFTSVQPLALASYPPLRPGSATCAGGDLAPPSSSSADPAVQVHPGPERGAVLWGWGGSSADQGGKGGCRAGCQASREESFQSRLLPGSPCVTAILTLGHAGFMRPHLVLRASPVKTQMGRGALGQVAPAWPAAHSQGAAEGLAGICEPWPGRTGLGSALGIAW